MIPDPSDPDRAVYIFAVNHLPHPFYDRSGATTANQPAVSSPPKAQSQLELFHHTLGSTTITHLRSISHPLIQTPNDIHALSPTSLYLTNDHHYRSGALRQIEDLFPIARWSNVLHLNLTSLTTSSPSSNLTVTPALTSLHNLNGLGHNSLSPSEVVLTSAGSGILYLAQPISPSANDFNLSIKSTIEIPSTLDNPSFFSDTLTNGSYILAGLLRASDFLSNTRDPNSEMVKDPVVVWSVTKRDPRLISKSNKNSNPEWEKKILWQDDGSTIRSGTTAVLVGDDNDVASSFRTDTRKGGGGWLFVTGCLSKSIIAFRIEDIKQSLS